jgi:hypothetical protein
MLGGSRFFKPLEKRDPTSEGSPDQKLKGQLPQSRIAGLAGLAK